MAKAYKNWTLQEKYADMLKKQGAVECEATTRKYRVFRLTDGAHVFLGKGGAVRICRNTKATVSHSVDVMKLYRSKLERYELANGLAEIEDLEERIGGMESGDPDLVFYSNKLGELKAHRKL